MTTYDARWTEDATHALSSGPPRLIVESFPQPGTVVMAVLEQLELAQSYPPVDSDEVRARALTPRPWDPATCTGTLRTQVWLWLDQVSIWVNEQHLWNTNRPGIPECWPKHPHIAHELALLACTRLWCAYATTPDALSQWQQSTLPSFLDHLQDQLGGSCQPGRHLERPRLQRDRSHAARATRAVRAQSYRDDVDVESSDPTLDVDRGSHQS